MEFIEISSEEVRNKTPKQIVEELKQKLREKRGAKNVGETNKE